MQTTPQALEHSEEGRAFFQRRVATFGLYGSSLGWFFAVYRFIQAAAIGKFVEELRAPSMIYHLLGAGSLFVIWVALRSGSRSVPIIRAVELVGLGGASAFYSLMGMHIPAAGMPHYIVLLALAFGLMARAVYVPSSATRTAVVTIVSGIPLLVVTYLMYLDVDLEPWRAIYPNMDDVTSAEVARGTALFTGAWWASAVVLCASASRVIYGLRTEVRDVRRLGQYTLVEKLGEGGMGTVYRAEHAMLRRPTAVKLLPADKAGEQNIARFEKEVQLTAVLTHPNTITIFDYGRTPDGVFYYAMELLDGATLADIVDKTGPQSAARAIHILAQATGALAEAHGIGLIHRDVKPANIMLIEQGGVPDVAKVLDFGLVKELEGAEGASLTKADSITGTPQYLSPEGIKTPNAIDARSDLYALGAVGYFLLTGQHVFTGATVVEICSAHLHTPPAPPSERTEAAIPADLEALLMRCLAKDPADRPQSARELQAALLACADAGGWTDALAEGWWAEHRDALADHRAKNVTPGSGLTLDIDVARRARVA